MNEKDVLIDLFNYFSGMAHHSIDSLDLSTLAWQNHPEANNISHTLWHISRSIDILKTRCIKDRSIDEEIWFSQDWQIKTGYNPKGIGWNESGNLAGYTLEEVKQVPILSSDELLSYLDVVIQEMVDFINQIDLKTLHETAPGKKDPSLSRYDWIWSFMIDGIQHLGEIKAILAMYERKHKTT